MSVPLATFLTAVRDGASTIERAIESVRSQTVPDWEYLIVDDGSQDDTATICEHAAKRDPRIRLLRRRCSGGPYVAANDGLVEARGRFVLRLDADDLAFPDRLERQVAYLERTGLRACGAGVEEISLDGTSLRTVLAEEHRPRSLKWMFCVGYGLAHSTACIEREALEQIGGYRPLPMSQDLRMWCDLSRREWVGAMSDVVVYLQRPGRMTQDGRDVQDRLAGDVLGHHLRALTDSPWSEEEVRALRPGDHGLPIRTSLRAIERWERCWSEDPKLGATERRELRRVGRSFRAGLAKRAVRWGQGGDALRTIASLTRSLRT